MLALEYAKQGIRVNAVSPGAIETDMFDRLVKDNPQAREQMMAMHPLGRVGKSEEIANAVVWFCSDEAAFVTGQTLALDGGATAQ